MVPILFAPSATVFTTNGVGRLSDAMTCVVKEERNGAFELEMTYPLGGKHFDSIVHSAIIVAKPSARRGLQAFRIYKISKPLNGKVKILAQHISYQLSFIPVQPFSASSLSGALSGFSTNAVESCPFTLTADFTSNSSFAVPLPSSIRSYLGGQQGSILSIYGGEWEFNNYSCVLHEHRGQDNGYVIRYGKNLVDLKQEQNIENTYTGIYPFWASDEVKVELPEHVLHAATASNFPFQRTVVKDFSDKFDNAPSARALREYTQAFMTRNNIGIPNVNLSVNFVHLADYADIDLCDTVTVYFEKLGVSVRSKVIETKWNVLKDRYDSVQVGDKKNSLSDTIEDQADQLSERPTAADMNRSIDRATGVLNSGTRGHIIINRNSEGWANEILCMDNESLASAVRVLRINMNGIGFSSTGYSGNFWQSWTMDGNLTLGGVNDAYGCLWILDESANPQLKVDKDGLKLLAIAGSGYLYNGVMYTDQDHTTAMAVTSGKFYYDIPTRAIYKYTGSAYVTPTGNEGLLAKMTQDGLGIYAGDIDLKWNGQTGIKFANDGTSDELYIGDFMVSTAYGRQIFESSDETTGMSGDPDTPGGLFMWAGYFASDDYRFAVNDGGAYVMYNGRSYNIGETLDDYRVSLDDLTSAVGAYVRAHSSDDGNEPDPDADTPNPDEAYLEDGLIDPNS